VAYDTPIHATRHQPLSVLGIRDAKPLDGLADCLIRVGFL
jgi:hypothetical protein